MILPLPEIVEAIAQSHHERVFCHILESDKDYILTYGELWSRAGCMAGALAVRGVRRRDPVPIILRHSPDLLIAFVGAMRLGAIPAILAHPSEKQDPALYAATLSALIRRISAPALVTYPELKSWLESRTPSRATLLLPSDLAAGRGPPMTKFDLDDTVLLQHSSGTTGLKKGVALSHRAVASQVEAYRTALNLRGDDVIVSWLPLYHDMGLIAAFLLPLLTGTQLVLMSPFDWVIAPHRLFEAIDRYRGTLCWLPNFAFQFLAGHTACRQYDLASMRAFINCSEPCRPATFDAFLAAFASCGVRPETLQCCYAMAEDTFATTQTVLGKSAPRLVVNRARFLESHEAVPVDGGALEFLSVGQAIPGHRVRVVDPARRPVHDGQVGEIAIASDSLFSGYFRLPGESRSVMDAGWYYTGDLGFFHGGHLYITGRKKDILIVCGRNFYAHDIEACASDVPGVKSGRVAAFSLETPETGTEEVVVVAESEAPPAEWPGIVRRIKGAVSSSLDLLVARVEIVPSKWLVKTTSGKISRADNKAKYFAAFSPQPNT